MFSFHLSFIIKLLNSDHHCAYLKDEETEIWSLSMHSNAMHDKLVLWVCTIYIVPIFNMDFRQPENRTKHAYRSQTTSLVVMKNRHYQRIGLHLLARCSCCCYNIGLDEWTYSVSGKSGPKQQA